MSPATMRAVVSRGGTELALERVARPEPGPGEVRVAVSACGICGSDLHLLRAGFFQPGHVPGHEIAGVVDALGEGVSGLATGTPVAVEPFRSCGECAQCREGRDPTCAHARLLGVHAPGGLADYVVAPAKRLFAASEPLDPGVLALAEPLAVSVHGLRRGALAAGERVLVLGAGSVGLLTLFAARALGAGEVWITARHPHQAELARALGADRVLLEAQASAVSLGAIGREARIDLAVETVGGEADTLNDAAAAVAPGGNVVVLGMFMAPVTLQTLPLLMKEVSLVWSYCYHHPIAPGAGRAPDFADAVSLLTRQPAAAALLVRDRFALDQAPAAFARAADKRAGATKVCLVP